MHSFDKALKKAIKSGSLVRIFRDDLDPSGTLRDGYPLKMENGFLLTLNIAEGIWLGGFSVNRVSDITEMDDPAENAAFIERALKLKGEQFPTIPQINLNSVRSILESAAAIFPLITIHREHVDPDICQIGKLESAGKSSFMMREIDSSAEWVDEQEQYDYDDITGIDFGGAYEHSLALVAGLVN
jgi:hypothetical protein